MSAGNAGAVIVGGGQAAVQAIASLRAAGYTGSLTIICDELTLPYQRPPLSKDYLLGKLSADRLLLRPESFYVQNGCRLLIGTAAVGVDRASRRLHLADGRAVGYEKLLFATGSSVKRLSIPGADLPGLHYLRTAADAEKLRGALGVGKRLAIVGGGYVGLEVAAVAAALGAQVTVFEAADRLMPRAVSCAVSDFYKLTHEAAGVRIVLRTPVERFEGSARIEAVIAAGISHPTDLVVVGVGVLANDRLAKEAGLETQDGIVVDEHTRTSDPAIFAAGDCTRHPDQSGELRRLECVQNAIGQAKHAASAMLGISRAYFELPWFWSDQLGLKLQIAGLSRQDDQPVVRGDPASRKFSVFHLRAGRIAAVEAVNSPADYMTGKKLIAAAAEVDVARLRDPSSAIC